MPEDIPSCARYRSASRSYESSMDHLSFISPTRNSPWDLLRPGGSHLPLPRQAGTLGGDAEAPRGLIKMHREPGRDGRIAHFEGCAAQPHHASAAAGCATTPRSRSKR